MCGIAGFELRGDDAPSVTASMLAAMQSRGPDGGWWRTAASWALAQTRLAVIDLSPQVKYPMPNESRDVWLLFNGEIYNHDELRRELEAAGHRFATRCDAEVAVHGYEEWGVEVFRRLSGMWAIALADERTRELLLARDARGIKPLVRTTGERFGFSSDALALVRAGLSRGEIDRQAIAEYAAFHYVPPPLTGLTDVRHVEPGTVVRRDARGGERVERWAGPVFGKEPSAPVELDEADEILREAVRRQLRADVPVGVFLSGGLDSALVLDYACEVGARPVALTMGFAGAGDYDETAAARESARRLGVAHHVGTLDAGFVDAVERVAGAYDMPFGDPSAIATLPLAALARRHVTVVLSGTGGDDLFAGYHRHRVPWLHRAVASLPPPVAAALERLDPGSGAERASSVALARSYVARLARGRRAEDVQLYLEVIGSSTSPAGRALLREPEPEELVRGRVAERHGLYDGPLSVAGIQEFELRAYLAGDLLVKEDRATMAHSVEGRVPLLDDAVIALAARTPLAQRTNLLAGKRLLRAIARRRLPRSHAARRKRGFAVPLARLLTTTWGAEASEWLRDSQSQLVDLRGLANRMGDPDISAQDVWALSTLAAWEHRLNRLPTEPRPASPTGVGFRART